MMKKQVLFLIVFLVVLTLSAPVNASFDVSPCESVQPGDEINSACMAVMESFPAPAVLPVRVDRTTLNSYDFWRVTATSPNMYDGPGGNVIGQMPAGYNFVNVVNTAEGWVQTESGEWMQTADVDHRIASEFAGVRILDGLENRFGWVLGTHVTSPVPGAEQNTETGRVVYRYDLVNIFGEVEDEDGWIWYMVGPDEWIDQRMLTVASRIERPEGVSGRWVAVDLYEQSLVAYEDDTPVFATVIATGLPGWDTREGIFEVWAKIPRDGMAGSTGAPDAYALQSVPWVMYFDNDISLHGTYWHNDFGYRRSHGCVNLSISDARFIFEWFDETPPLENGDPAPHYVYVHASAEYRVGGAATK